MQYTYCKRCGGELKGNEQYCPYCGVVHPMHKPMYSQNNENSGYNTPQNMPVSQPNPQSAPQKEKKDYLDLSCLLGLIFSLFLQPLGFIFSLIGIVKSKKHTTNRTLAKAGIVISIVEFLLFIGFFIFFSKIIAENPDLFTPIQ